jgi:glycosyltransferase involved in cell wall biosynthesis
MQEQNPDVRKNICIVSPSTHPIGDIAQIFGTLLEKAGYTCRYIDSKPLFKFKMLVDLIKNVRNYGVLHVHSSGLSGDIPLLWVYVIAKIFRKPYIVTWHCGSPVRVLEKTRFFNKIFFRSAILVTVPSVYSRDVVISYLPDAADNVIVFPNLLDLSDRSLAHFPKEQKKVITVSTISTWYIHRKGLDLFVQSARFLPDFDYYVIGKYDNSIENLRKYAPGNVHFTGYEPSEKLLQHYLSAKTYCQFSISESFGYALAEAMACECVPVLFRSTALPEVAGDTGYYIDTFSPEQAAKQIVQASVSDNGQKARERIIELFSVETRGKEFVDIITSAIMKNNDRCRE